MTAAAEGSRPLVARSARPSRLLQSEAVQGFALISPTFLYALVLLAVPILIVIAHSFWTQNYLTIDRTFTLEQYRIALTEPIYRELSVPLALHLAGGQHRHGRARLSDRLLHLLPWRASQEPLAVPDHHPLLDQLSAARDVVEGHPRLWRRAEFRADGARHHRRAADLAALQLERRHHHADPCLGGFRDPADLRVAGEGRPLAARGGDGPRRRAVAPLHARDAAADPARRHLGAADRHDPDRRRFRHAEAWSAARTA